MTSDPRRKISEHKKESMMKLRGQASIRRRDCMPEHHLYYVKLNPGSPMPEAWTWAGWTREKEHPHYEMARLTGYCLNA